MDRHRPSVARVVLVAALAFGSVVHATSAAAPQDAQRVESVLTAAGPISVVELAGDLTNPWGMAFLPDGRLLVTERPGRLRIVAPDGTVSEPVSGVPEVFAQGQGGLLDVALHPDFAANRLIYLSYAKPGPGRTAATALGRGRLVEGELRDFEDIFVQRPWIEGSAHFGNRVVFAPDGTLFLTLGERFQFDPAQDLSNTLGKVVRLEADGSVPPDNPFVDREDAEAAIWSYGHRNIESAAIDPETGLLWIAEMGPLGGDELNQPKPGRNYGWPLVSWGMHYDGEPIPDPPTRPELADAVEHWSPVISPSGMVFYTGDVFDEWRGSTFIGGLSSHQLFRIRIEDGDVVEEERIPLPARIRDVEQGPDGLLYLLTDKAPDGALWQIKPLQ